MTDAEKLAKLKAFGEELLDDHDWFIVSLGEQIIDIVEEE